MASMPLDPGVILTAMHFPRPELSVPVTGGTATAIWRVEIQGRRYALRVFPPESEAVCEREVLAMQAASAASIPVPEIEARGSWERRPVLLLSWMSGDPLVEFATAEPWRARELGVMFGRMQARIHTVHAPAALIQTRRTWIDWPDGLDGPLRARLAAEQDDRRALLHFDYHPLNVLTDGSSITGVLDWTNVQAGDPRADAARTLSIMRLVADITGLLPMVARRLKRDVERGWRLGYEEAGGALQDMAAFYAWAGNATVADLAHKRSAQELSRMRRWAGLWERRALR